jgi:hypothetical protein
LTRRTIRIAGILMLGLALAGCGKKGAPMAPKDEPNVYPRAYPSDASTPAPPVDRGAFPSIDQPNTNIDPTQPRVIGQPGSTE